MAVLGYISSPWAPLVVVLGIAAFYLYPYFVTYGHLRQIPAPFPAQFSDLWLLSVVRRGNRYQRVHDLHKKLGPVVRIQPNHISLNDDDAIQVVLGHGSGLLKSSFYDAFVSIRRGLFNTRDRTEHSRKRKIVSHTFSAKSIVQFEPYIHGNLELFVAQLDKLIKTTPHRDRAAHFDCLEWFNFLAFDVIGDLAFGAPFGMLAAGADIAEVRASPTSPPIYAPAIDILNRRGEVSAALGALPELKPYAKYLPDPFFTKGLEAVENLAGIAIARVKERLENPPPVSRKDLLERLMEGRDDRGEPLGREELTAEALTQLIAGSDTTSNSSCALLFHVVRTPGVVAKLQAELDAAIPRGVDVPTFDMVRDLPYLAAVVNETLRHHSTSGIGLPREIPADAKQGIHFRGPERWEALTPRQKNAFIPFSYGPRACVGRNVAEMEMKLIVATWARRYEVFLRQDYMDTREGFLRKPLGLEVGLRRREGV
ncbi:putative benzoate 4-monooxygenase cytochrome P450 [Bombardia bombarda]|uniref:Benzoate 4-monooxygenase cytochrome P450 n=1 Tax=Bombardia bombarda TaxID=252184 RepID=A0AA39XL49_9PEZI|nr:putative benzoate 4-monooxygenase cytochrome P450 [Bombardia bombarda]